MSSKRLLILFGHENSGDQLSAVAMSRCNTAIELARDDPSLLVLPTGAFGKHFNTTSKPHWRYLAHYLIDRGIPQSQILPGTDSSNTIEDCLRARKIAVDGRFDEVIAVTSDYHVPRVEFVLNRLFAGIAFRVHGAPTPKECQETEGAKERKSFRRLKKEWITPPLYKGKDDFPRAIYAECANEQRHYDTVSLAPVTAILVVAAFPFLNDLAVADKTRAVIFWAAAGINALLLAIYLRAAQAARFARQVLKMIEIAYEQPGFSANYDPRRSRFTLPMKWAVVILGLGVILILAFGGIVLYWDLPLGKLFK